MESGGNLASPNSGEHGPVETPLLKQREAGPFIEIIQPLFLLITVDPAFWLIFFIPP